MEVESRAGGKGLNQGREEGGCNQERGEGVESRAGEGVASPAYRTSGQPDQRGISRLPV